MICESLIKCTSFPWHTLNQRSGKIHVDSCGCFHITRINMEPQLLKPAEPPQHVAPRHEQVILARIGGAERRKGGKGLVLP